MKIYAELTRKQCSTCREKKELTEFNKDKRSTTGFCFECKKCRSKRRKLSQHKISAYNKKWRSENLEYAKLRDKRHNLKRNFRLTLEEYEHMKAAQNYGCAICQKNRSSIKKDLCVDHDHETGKIRGLLCDNCNRGIGLLQDNINLLHKAIEYLTNSKK